MNALVVESLESRLAREVPGAQLISTSALGPMKAWTVIVGNDVLERASSRREAVEKAISVAQIKRVQR